MPEHVRSDVHIDGGKRAVFLDGSTDMLVGKRPSCLVDEEVVGTLNIRKITFPVFCKGMYNVIIAKLKNPLFRTFSKDKDCPVGKINVICRKRT